MPEERARTTLAAALLLVLLVVGRVQAAGPVSSVEFPVRGKSLTLTIYNPPVSAARKGTVIMASGDVGWVGLAVDMCKYLSDQGWIAVGVNSRQYLGAFTSGKKTLQPADVPLDYDAMVQFLMTRRLILAPVIVSGVSEGAGLSVLAASREENHAWAAGVITMGLPATAELGWRWTDFTSWITKKDSDEPQFRPADYIARISPTPLCMLQSVKDEYVPESDYRMFERTARDPKRQVLIDASNHRFTDRIPDLRKHYLGCLAWIDEQKAK